MPKLTNADRVMIALRTKEYATIQEIANMTGIPVRSLSHTFKEMTTDGKIYITEWTSAAATATGIYAIGNKPSAPKPDRREIQQIRQEKKGIVEYKSIDNFDPANPRCDMAASWIRSAA